MSTSSTVVKEVEAGAKRVCHHIRGQLAGRGKLLNKNVGNTLNEALPVAMKPSYLLGLPEKSGGAPEPRCDGSGGSRPAGGLWFPVFI